MRPALKLISIDTKNEGIYSMSMLAKLRALTRWTGNPQQKAHAGAQHVRRSLRPRARPACGPELMPLAHYANACDTVQFNVKTSHSVCRKCRVPSLNYADTCDRVFQNGPRSLKVYSAHVKNFVNCTMAGVCLGGTSVYVIFIASAVKDVSDNFCPSYKLSIHAYCAILLVPLILITQLRHLKFLVPFSVFANVCLFVIFGITCYYTFNTPNVSQRRLAVPVSEWPLFVRFLFKLLRWLKISAENVNFKSQIGSEKREAYSDFTFCKNINNSSLSSRTLVNTYPLESYLTSL
ncbi:Proton-coupled amino acid transporter-like protein CG1139 [Eumeta japonica]|uniref:Proton-coupled amino acid transporter-like protein CG1139 n=1 Tax=Eumeta variegata TaxID=151549 RepID=A0A4C1WKB5_EUMVA|nr:Proton-coupled amino acid transporter-like protein CG1139 [Eumeta japonica]